MDVNIGITDADRKEIADGLADILADSYTLYLRTQNYHWNVEGELFIQLHELFEGQYNELADAIDVIAERIRSLGHAAPGSYQAFSERTTLATDPGEPEAFEMIQQLVNGHEEIIKNIREVIDRAEEAGDEATADLLTERLEFHSKTAWMLRSHLA